MSMTCEFERIWVLLFIDRSVEESGQCWCEEVDEVSEDDGLDFVDIGCFVCLMELMVWIICFV